MKAKSENKVVDPNLIAYCGLYCGACSKFAKGKCPGCKGNEKAKWCKIRSCNIENTFSNCSECNIDEFKNCKKLNNPIGKIFEFVFKTDRLASVKFIKEVGAQDYCVKMAELGQMSIKKGQKI